MNERIQQLAKQATVNGNTEHHMDIPSWYLEKFARLIVQECIDTVLDCTVEYSTRPQIAEELREHFGVEL